jgi:PAS domain S-box-containing protein
VDLRQFQRILIQVFLLPVFALLLLAFALYTEIRSGSDTTNQLVKSDQRIAQAMLVTRLIADEETRLRGYQLTGDPAFLEPFHQTQSDLEAQFTLLGDMPDRDQPEIDHIQHLREEHDTWRDAFAQPVIANIRAGGQANDIALNLHGKQLMDLIRSDLDSIIHEEQSRRAALIRLRQTKRDSLVRAVFVLSLGIGIFIGLFTRSRLHAVSDAYGTSLDMLKRRADELFESEQELRTTLASIGDGVITCDSEGHIEMMNPVAQQLTGWSLDQAKGLPLEQVFPIVSETTRAPVQSPVAKVMQLGGPVGHANHAILIRKDGTQVHIADSGAPIAGKNGETTGVVLVFRDITRERRTQEALLATEKLAVAGRLAATIAHEIHNPLDSVANLLYLMRTGTDQEESRQFMIMAEQELARVTQISRAMLGLYRESKTPVQVDLREMLQEILLLMERRLTDLGVKVHTELPEAIKVDGFPAELRQVFSNLITNAAEATGSGGEIWVSISPQAAGNGPGNLRTEAGATIHIRDNGPGIPTEVQPQIFQPFFTTKGERGTGLGLWVSRGIVNKHGGRINIQSNTSDDAHNTLVSVFLATRPTMQPEAD